MKHRDTENNQGRNLWLRIALAIAGALWFVWLGVEDPGTITVLIMAIAMLSPILIIGLQRFAFPLPRSDKRRAIRIIFIAVLSGLLITPAAITLMAVKTALHNHVVPDFTRADIIAVLRSTPAWTLGALLLAAAGALYDRTLKE